MSTETAEWHPSVSPWVIAGAVVLAAFIEVLDTTIVSVALPHMAGSLSSTTDEATWVLTSYLVANAVVLPASGWFAIRFGRKRFLMACTAIFIFASFLCGIAPTMSCLVLARILQGAGGGALQPITQAVLLESFPKEKRGMAMAVFGIAVVIAPIIGPTLGGWLTDNYSWRWVFNINIPIGLVALFLMGRYLEDPPYIKNAKIGSIDTIGFGLLTLWLATLQIVLDKGQNADWFATAWIRWFSVISAGSLIALIVWELRVRDPIVDLKVFQNRNFWVGTTIITVVSAGMYGSLTTLPLFLQNLMGYTSEAAGWATAPRGIGGMLSMVLVGVLLARMDGRWITACGIAGFTAATLLLGRMTLEVGMSNIAWPNVLQGASIGLVFVPIMALSMATLPNDKIGNASGVFNLMRNLGGSIGISVSTTYVTRFAQSYQAQMMGHLTPLDPVYQQRLAGFTAGLTPLTGAPQAAQQAHGLMYLLVQQQANYQAFMAVFGWSALLVGALFLTPLLMKKVVGRGEVVVH
jgi:MFS transporter, DHA2 family, multidrug resistance protein